MSLREDFALTLILEFDVLSKSVSSFLVSCHLSAYDVCYKKGICIAVPHLSSDNSTRYRESDPKIGSNPQTAITAAIIYRFISKTPALRHILTMPCGTSISRMHHVPTKLKENS